MPTSAARAWCVLALLVAVAPARAIGDGPAAHPFAQPGTRVLLDAHNAYPDGDRWWDRIDRALATGLPVAIEQDLVWYCDPARACRSIVSHGEPFTGREPGLREYFFERIRPFMEAALASPDRRPWPLVTLNLDFKTDEPEHHAAVWALLGEYEGWLTTAPRGASVTSIAPLRVGPLLVLTGEAAAQELSFHDRVPAGGHLRLFGAVAVERAARASAPPDTPDDAIAPRGAVPGPRTNYRRWWNNPWAAVEGGGPPRAGAWTAADDARLRALVRQAHDAGLWIRFYALNGHAPGHGRGYHEGYNFGSRAAVEARWRAVVAAGVDFVATDQYEAFAAFKQQVAAEPATGVRRP
jgi:hypothetical protein